ncbi:MAG TPA: GNAT family N-acetyltransferase [Dehalococcoidia bacterium]|nr:GNAT family N-acetyltransferase [Dehalococcoidia bacterium]
MIISTKVVLRNKRTDDAWEDYSWETDPELARLDAAPVLRMPYTEYLEEYTSELRYYYSSGKRFAIDTIDGEHIGNCSYYNFDEVKGETELGIMIGNRDYWDGGYGSDAVTTLVNHIFNTTRIHRIYLKTLNWNDRAQRCFQKCGFNTYGESTRGKYHFILMEILRTDWELGQPLPQEQS